ncbi:hypothetical protein [Novosphingobium sp. BL-52-GroH]|uniref:DUF7713 domain-containing protein n=1 Tax=Novosphingobium sp. BL-52-GroH TaxID=3349877 RepID=UPI00384EB7E2
MNLIACQNCCREVPGFDIVHYGDMETGYRDMCSRCFNDRIASGAALDSVFTTFQPIALTDARGLRHIFHLRLLDLGDRVTLDALEVRDDERDGYQFQALGEAGVDPFDLLARLLKRIRRALAQTHLVERGQRWEIDDRLVRGRITSDLDRPTSTPVVIIDGREISWNDFGEMLLTFEGWQFELAIHDPSDDT